jgi:hypothetical protein
MRVFPDVAVVKNKANSPRADIATPSLCGAGFATLATDEHTRAPIRMNAGALLCHPCAGRGPGKSRRSWIPACAGMTEAAALRRTVIVLEALRDYCAKQSQFQGDSMISDRLTRNGLREFRPVWRSCKTKPIPLRGNALRRHYERGGYSGARVRNKANSGRAQMVVMT